MTKSEILKTAKPILFNTEMVRAILEGRKMVTRRILKTSKYIPDDAKFGYTAFTPAKSISVRGHFANNEYGESFIKLPCQPGDFLYVRETWGFDNHNWLYRADFSDTDLQKLKHLLRWRPSIHMPKEAARLFLRVKDVRVERLQDITITELQEEGVLPDGYISQYSAMTTDGFEQFKTLWDSTLKKSDMDKYGWNANPWVWVIEFERVEVDK